jgi:hypothetical protein
LASYVDPPAHAVVLSVDEKSQIQALDRTQPGLPMKPGRLGTMTHDYKRHGTTTLFAALDVLDGKVIGRNMQRHRHQEFICFLGASSAPSRPARSSTPSSTTTPPISTQKSAHFQNQLRFFGMAPSFAFVREPETNGVARAVHPCVEAADRLRPHLLHRRRRRPHRRPDLLRARQPALGCWKRTATELPPKHGGTAWPQQPPCRRLHNAA